MSVAQTDSPIALRLPAYAGFAGLLAAAGLPLYIHAPKFYIDQYGVSLGALGAVLFGLRLLDVVQDPFFGWLSERLQARRAATVAVAVTVLAAAMIGLFAIVPPIAPLLWFGLMLTLVFSAFSYLTISFYAQGVAKAEQLGPSGHLRIARWREAGALIGICAAALAPWLLAGATRAPFAAFALGYALMAMVMTSGMRGEWHARARPYVPGLRSILGDPISRRLLVIGFLNAAPAAVTSTLFLFFVGSRLAAPGAEGGLLLLFFLSAAIAAPIWGSFAERYGPKRILIIGMTVSIATFGFAMTLGAGDVIPFAVICVVSGAALGADMTVLPAMFAAQIARISPGAAEGFGLWSFVSKSTLAFAAVLLLPALEGAGFRSGAENTPEALALLTLFYAALPCGLKAIALTLLVFTDLKES